MFFIGVFGIDNKEKEIKILNIFAVKIVMNLVKQN